MSIINQRTKSQLFCKTHQGQPGIYFLADQPWNKFCSECALNLALCGKKIDKDLSAQQLDNKTHVLRIVQKIRNTMLRIDNAKKSIDQIVTKIQKVSKSQLTKIIHKFDQYVRNLCETRDQIIEQYQRNFPQCSQSYFQKQTKILLAQIELQKNLQYIQTNYRSIIQNKLQSPINLKIEQWNCLISNIDLVLPKANQEEELAEALNSQIVEIRSKLGNVEPFKCVFNDNIKLKSEFRTDHTTYSTLHTLGYQQCNVHSNTSSSLNINISNGNSNNKENPRRAQLKLRSKSKHSDKKSQKQCFSVKAKKSVKDISNSLLFDSFNI